jgi:hypothetical protein
MNTMKIPGFTAEASVDKMRGGYGCSATNGRNRGGREVVSQLKGSVFHRPLAVGLFGTIEDYWTCKQGCETAYSACLETCEGTVGSPSGSSNCITCDENYRACLDGCSRDIA